MDTVTWLGGLCVAFALLSFILFYFVFGQFYSELCYRRAIKHFKKLVCHTFDGTRDELDDVATIKAELKRVAGPLHRLLPDSDYWSTFMEDVGWYVDLTSQAIRGREEPEFAKRNLMYEAEVRILERGENIGQDVLRAVRLEVLKSKEREIENRQALQMKLLTMRQELNKTLIFVQEEARKNPGFNDLFLQVRSIYDNLATLSPDDPHGGIDVEALKDLIEEILIKKVRRDS